MRWRRLQFQKNGRAFAAHPWVYSVRQALVLGGVVCVGAFLGGATLASAVITWIAAVPAWLLLTRFLLGPYCVRRAA
jgi:hypothetical protein